MSYLSVDLQYRKQKRFKICARIFLSHFGGVHWRKLIQGKDKYQHAWEKMQAVHNGEQKLLAMMIQIVLIVRLQTFRGLI